MIRYVVKSDSVDGAPAFLESTHSPLRYTRTRYLDDVRLFKTRESAMHAVREFGGPYNIGGWYVVQVSMFIDDRPGETPRPLSESVSKAFR